MKLFDNIMGPFFNHSVDICTQCVQGK